MFPLDFDRSVFLAIGLSAAVTYGLRVGGLLLAQRLPRSGGFKRFMDALPGTILLSLVAPGILAAGPAGCFAAACTVICARKSKNLFLAMLIGVGIMAAYRQVGG